MYRVGIITLSDKGYAGEREDKSGPAIAEALSAGIFAVEKYIILPDDKEMLKKELVNMADNLKLDLVLTTGGTGFSMRDNTPEATLEVADRNAPGIAEAIRYYSLGITKRAMLGRGASVIRGFTLIINLPGSPKAVREALEFITDSLPHGLDILKGEARECAGE